MSTVFCSCNKRSVLSVCCSLFMQLDGAFNGPAALCSFKRTEVQFLSAVFCSCKRTESSVFVCCSLLM